jgi:serine/threonine protein kinase
MIVLDYADYGSLRNYLDRNYNKISWYTKIHDLWRIAYGLKKIHGKELIHCDLHIGNILRFFDNTSITDMGLCKPANYDRLENTNIIYGVLPYIAPEVLRGQNFTKAADIYSFGIIMYEVISGLPPYHDISHDNILAMKICQGFRPRFNIKVPQLIVHLIKRCLDAYSLNRPTAVEIEFTLYQWWSLFDYQKELKKQIKEAEEINNNLLTSKAISHSLSYETHSEAIYTSRLLDFNNLPEPKNAGDYYIQTDDIISMGFSGNLKSYYIKNFQIKCNKIKNFIK